MGPARFKLLSRASLALAVGAILAAVAGCASVTPGEAPSLTKASAISPAVARDQSIVGKTKRDVQAALGPTARVTFDSGYEIWVYHLSDGPPRRAASQSEFVVLFDPAGVVTKTRVRPAPGTGTPRG